MTASAPPSARELVRNLIDLEIDARDDEVLAEPGATLVTAERLYHELSQWVGGVGCYALFTRALADAQLSHPLLTGLRLQNNAQPYIGGTAEIIQAYGASPTDQALEAMLVTLVEILGRLIGDDMAMTLILRSLPELIRDTKDRESGRKHA